MNVQIRDRAALMALTPSDVAAYLQGGVWIRAGGRPGEFAIWRTDDREIVLPLDPTVSDYSLRIAEVLASLAEVEQRSPLEILRDLSTASADVIRIRLRDEGEAGTLPVSVGATVMDHARDLLLAAASATIAPRPCYGPRRPAIAEDYLRRARFGQTEQGSYVITIISKVTPDLAQDVANLPPPFDRQVVVTLAKALNAAHLAARDAAVSRDFGAFQERVPDGVSANLCDALVHMAGGIEAPRDLSFSFTWSSTRAVANAVREVRMGQDVIPTLSAAARVFRETAPLENYRLIGPVTRLERRAANGPGTIQVTTVLEDRYRTVSVELPEMDYNVAVQAHGDGLVVACEGRLLKDGRRLVLEHARNFIVDPPDEELF